MASATTTALEVPAQDSLKNRLNRSRSPSNVIETAEEVLVEKLDYFISSIESRLVRFEQFFKFNNEEREFIEQRLKSSQPAGREVGNGHRRTSSSSSIQQFRQFSANKLDLICERLELIKKSMLRNSFSNLDTLYKLLDDQYNYLFSNSAVIDEEEDLDDLNNVDSTNIGPYDDDGCTDEDSKSMKKREILSKKIITTIQYFDEKLLAIDDFIKESRPAATDDYSHDAVFSQLRFFNFNRALRNARKRYLHYYELPLVWRENKYIISGYRFSLSHKEMLKSMFHFNHNESMNIWSHIIGLVVVLYICIYHFPLTDVFEQNSRNDNILVYVFLVAAAKCLVNSSLWHTYSCFAHYPTRSAFACVDYTGITVLITSSILTVEYCALYKYPKLLITYVVCAIICGVAGLAFNWSPYFDKPECRSIRIGFFVGLSASGASSLVCKAFYDGVLSSLSLVAPLIYKSFVWYCLGVVFYGGLIPERWRYDVIIEENLSKSNRHYQATDVILEKTGHDGEEEMEVLHEEFEDIIEDESKQNGNDSMNEDEKFQDLINKHFKSKLTKSPYCNNFMSLWWVDYFMASHNIWHICVVLGILGHYFCVLDMFRGLERDI